MVAVVQLSCVDTERVLQRASLRRQLRTQQLTVSLRRRLRQLPAPALEIRSRDHG